MTKRRTTEEFIELSRGIHGDKYDYSLVEYKNKESKVDIICPIHGVFSQQPKLHLYGSGCPKCSYVYRGNLFKKGLDKFILDSNKIHNNFYSYDKFEYIESHVKGIITCPIHGEFEQKPNDHLNGKGCPKCNMSHLEREVYSFLSLNGIKFEIQKKFEWLGKMSLDFYLTEYNLAIECQGKQHFGLGGWKYDYDFDKQRDRDFLKKRLCDENGIKLVYYSNILFDFNEIYNKNNSFNSLDRILIDILGIKSNDWVDEVYDYYNSLVKNNDINKNVDIFCIDLEKNSEKHVNSSNELKKLKESRKKSDISIHIFEDEWLYKKNIVKSRLKNVLGITETKIFARKCEIREISSKDSKIFLENNHIQGNIFGKYSYGLYYNGELVSLMTFGSLRKSLGSKNVDNYYELLRFCNKLGTNVIGGASKLFNYFIREHKPLNIISYCDLRWSNGNLYNILGFKLKSVSRPNYFYVDISNKMRENRFKYRKDVLVKNGFDKNKSEHEIMLERGIYRVYDCGCNVYEYNK